MPARSLRLLLALVVLATAAGSPPASGKDEVQAEHDRLSDEIDKLASRQIWSGVERKYRELERLAVEPTFDDLLHGATAARELGDVERCYQRLKLAAKLDATKDVLNWLWEIDTNYGHVELLTVPSRAAELTADELPFDPNQRKAFDAAVASARQDGIFVGMLPKGSYTFATQGFQVEPGLAVRIEVSPRIRRQGLIDPVIIYRDEFGNPTTTSPTAAEGDSPPAPAGAEDEP